MGPLRIASLHDTDGADVLVSQDFDTVAKHFDEIFESLHGIESYNSPVASIFGRYVVGAGKRIIPELKHRFRAALIARDVDVLYVYLSRILFNWDRELVYEFCEELQQCVLLGPVDREEHDAEAACLILRHGISVVDEVAVAIPIILKRHPLVVQRYQLAHE